MQTLEIHAFQELENSELTTHNQWVWQSVKVYKLSQSVWGSKEVSDADPKLQTNGQQAKLGLLREKKTNILPYMEPLFHSSK